MATENHRRQLTDFIHAIKEDREPMVDGVEGRRTLEFIRAIYQSSDLGKEVHFRSRKMKNTERRQLGNKEV